MTSRAVTRELKKVSTKQRAETNAWFFKTGKGEYGEGDVFLGVAVPEQRKIAKQFRELPFVEIETLLKRPIHEHRNTALFILVLQFEKGDEKVKKRVVAFYKKHRRQVNNWDLVDQSAYQILGAQCVALGDPAELYAFAKRKSMWERRIAIVGTYAYIKQGIVAHTFSIAAQFLEHPEDLMHKATGWMLREAGKRDRAALDHFLHTHVRGMPRTMLRYAIEKHSEKERKAWLAA